jgi:hypothetical protein
MRPSRSYCNPATIKLKLTAVQNGQKISDVVRAMLEERLA